MLPRVRVAWQLIRPYQWGKNFFVLFPLPYAVSTMSWGSLASLLTIFVAFCCAASSGYVINDVIDVERDRKHPIKRYRPIAAGIISVRGSLALALMLAMTALVMSATVGLTVLFCLMAYMAGSFLYCLGGKHIPYIESGLVGSLFGIRVVAGIVAADIPLRGWPYFVAAASLLALAIEFSRRMLELRVIGHDSRPVLTRYSLIGLQTCFIVASLMATLAYLRAAWSIDPLYSATVGLVVFGLLRYWQAVTALTIDYHPQVIIARDRWQMANLGLFVLSLFAVTWLG